MLVTPEQHWVPAVLVAGAAVSCHPDLIPIVSLLGFTKYHPRQCSLMAAYMGALVHALHMLNISEVQIIWGGSLRAQTVKNLPAMRDTQV